MAFSFSKESIENLKNQINIVDVIGRRVKLKRAGANFKGLCPFHSEKTPSFMVSESRQYFNCFGCGAKGDVISFIEKYDNLEFTEAVEKLSEEYGIPMEKYSRAQKDDRKPYYEVNRMAAAYFYRAFTQGPNPGYTYMKGRQIEPRILKKFGIGYADASWDSLYRYLRGQGVSDKIMLELGLVSQGRGKIYDRFRNRVMFPIINTSGKVIGFGGRALDKDAQAKYLNSPESRVFQKKNNLYGLNISRRDAGKEHFLILVEGYMDAIALYQSGIQNVCASLGTALTENQARLIHRYTENVVLSYDADSAGRRAALRGIEILRNERCNVRVLHVTDGKDPDEFVKKNGKDAFLKLIDGALPYAEYKLDTARREQNLETSEGRIAYLKAAAVIIAGLDPVEQEEYIQKVASEMRISRDAMSREVHLARSGGGRNDYRQDRREEQRREQKSREIAHGARSVPPWERTLLKLVTLDPAWIAALDRYPGIMESGLSNDVIALLKSGGGNGPVDSMQLLDSLPQEEREVFQEILRNVAVDQSQADDVFHDCVRTWEINRMVAREKELITMLSMADENENADKIRAWSSDLMRVQKEIKRLQAGKLGE